MYSRAAHAALGPCLVDVALAQPRIDANLASLDAKLQAVHRISGGVPLGLQGGQRRRGACRDGLVSARQAKWGRGMNAPTSCSSTYSDSTWRTRACNFTSSSEAKSAAWSSRSMLRTQVRRSVAARAAERVRPGQNREHAARSRSPKLSRACVGATEWAWHTTLPLRGCTALPASQRRRLTPATRDAAQSDAPVVVFVVAMRSFGRYAASDANGSVRCLRHRDALSPSLCSMYAPAGPQNARGGAIAVASAAGGVHPPPGVAAPRPGRAPGRPRPLSCGAWPPALTGTAWWSRATHSAASQPLAARAPRLHSVCCCRPVDVAEGAATLGDCCLLGR